MKTTFSGTFEGKEDFWTYDFFLPEMALIVNASGALTLSCPEVVLEIQDDNDRLEWLWKDKAKIKRTECAEQGVTYIEVRIKRKGRWKHAASFTKEKDEI
jgi:hypothetical protein